MGFGIEDVGAHASVFGAASQFSKGEQIDGDMMVERSDVWRGICLSTKSPHDFAAGDVYSTVEDMFLWYQAVSSGKLISEELSQEMFTPHFAFPEDELDGYGYGWVIAKEYDRALYQHPGGMDGYSGVIAWFPEDDFAFILLSNQSDEDIYLIGNLIANIVYED